MTNENLIELTKSYGLTYNEVSVAAITAMLTRRDGEKKTLASLFDSLNRILTTDEVVDIIKWATWVKHANKEDLQGKTPDELIALQAKTAYA